MDSFIIPLKGTIGGGNRFVLLFYGTISITWNFLTQFQILLYIWEHCSWLFLCVDCLKTGLESWNFKDFLIIEKLHCSEFEFEEFKRTQSAISLKYETKMLQKAFLLIMLLSTQKFHYIKSWKLITLINKMLWKEYLKWLFVEWWRTFLLINSNLSTA